MSAPFSPGDRRRIIAAARLLQSDKPGEVTAAVSAIIRMLPNDDTLPDVIARGVAPASPRPVLITSAYIYRGSWKQCARMVQYCPDLSRWEREFVADILRLSSLSQRQESRLKAIFRKSEGVRS